MQSLWDSFLHPPPHDGQGVLLQAPVTSVWEKGPWTLLSTYVDRAVCLDVTLS